jgi:autotransporter-associated beta strand protein
VTLSGTNTYSGGTVVFAGTLSIVSANALPNGSSLTVGAGASSLFGASQAAPGLSGAGLAAPVQSTAAASETTAPILPTSALVSDSLTASAVSAVAPIFEGQVADLSYVSPAKGAQVVAETAARPRGVIDAVFAMHKSAFDRNISSADRVPSVRPWAWLAAIERFVNSSDQNKSTDSTVALDKILTEYGVERH